MPGRRVCRTADEWKTIDTASSDNDYTRDRRDRAWSRGGGLVDRE